MILGRPHLSGNSGAQPDMTARVQTVRHPVVFTGLLLRGSFVLFDEGRMELDRESFVRFLTYAWFSHCCTLLSADMYFPSGMSEQ